MKTLGLVGWLLAIAITIIAVLHDGCSGCGSVNNQNDTATTVTKVYDSNTYRATVAVIPPISEVLRLPGELIHDTVFIPASVDSMAVVIAYYTARYYESKYIDSNISVTFKDSLYKNEIIWKGFEYKWLKPTSIITNTIITQSERRNSWYVGLGTAVGLSSFPTAGPELLLTTPNRWAYRAGYYFGQNQSNVYASIYWRIGK